MTSMGEIRNDIEFTRRLLDENRVAVHVAVKRMVRVGLWPGRSMKEYMLLKKSLNHLEQRDMELHEEIRRLVVGALRIQIRGGDV